MLINLTSSMSQKNEGLKFFLRKRDGRTMENPETIKMYFGRYRERGIKGTFVVISDTYGRLMSAF
ncbi:hypothetical protein SAMN05428949_3379 [Chitinophaga sp. YR627]|nr:hypothetical protein SAMN05428949_3379 [Chitinophaga sp. YR627]